MYLIRNTTITILFGSVLALSGCASKPKTMTQEEFSTAMAQSSATADTLLEKGNREEAITILADLAKKNPGRKDPWVRMAKIHFDGENYAQAIVSAEEALQRDSADRTAKSIRAVGGLRVAAQSLADLRGDVELKGDARSDAVGLAKVMRETLGEDVLVPLDDKKKKPAPSVIRPKPSAVSGQAATAQPAVTKQQASTGAQSGNPFGALK